MLQEECAVILWEHVPFLYKELLQFYWNFKGIRLDAKRNKTNTEYSITVDYKSRFHNKLLPNETSVLQRRNREFILTGIAPVDNCKSIDISRQQSLVAAIEPRPRLYTRGLRQSAIKPLT